MCRDDDPLRVRALVGHAEDAEVRPVRLLLRPPVERGIDDDLVADPDAVDARPDAGHDACSVRAEHDRQLELAADPNPEVAPVQRGRDEVDPHLSRPRLGIRQLGDS